MSSCWVVAARGIATAFLSVMSLVATWGCGSAADEARDPARERAMALHREGLDFFARWDERGMFRRMRTAWEADPTYIPALLDLFPYYDYEIRLPEDVRVALDSLVRRDPAGAGLCARFVLSRERSLSAAEVPAAAGAGPGAHDCAVLAGVKPRVTEPEERLRPTALLWRRYPDSVQLVQELLDLLTSVRALDRLLDVTEVLTRPERHPLVRARGFAWRVNALHALGRHEEAAAARESGDAFVRRAEPGVRMSYLAGLSLLGEVAQPRRSDPVWPHVEGLMHAARERMYALLGPADLYVAAHPRAGQATELLDNGRLVESLELWDGLVAVADTFTAPFRALIYMRRGRTLSKLGRLRAAERDLLAAREAARRADDVDMELEVEHNLLHVYDALGRDDEARQAGQAFVRLTRIGRLRPVRMMSYYDLGSFLQRRGEHETARRMFEAMLASIDSMNDHHHWAGEYYELIGDLDRATAYYLRSWRENQFEATRSLGALARLAEATGDRDQALRYARAYDASMETGYPEHAPIVPGVQARGGRLAEAAGEFQRAREAARRRGQTAAWARLTLEAASLELERDAPQSAAGLADTAATAAESVARGAIAARGHGLAALARVYQGGSDRDAALAELRETVAQAERARDLQLGVDLHRMLGDALAAVARTEAALAAYARAASLSDSVAKSLAHDLVRAGFRAEQLRVSDQALTAVVATATHPDAPIWYAEWSMRRKGRGIRDVNAAADDRTGAWEGTGRSGAAPWRAADEVVRSVQAALAADQALVDFVVLESAVAALVMTGDGARVVRLPAESGVLRERVRALRAGLAPRIGSFVDLSRTSFDEGLARRLYADLLAPLEPILSGRTRLTIVPDAPLQLMPFDALIVAGPDSAPMYAIDRYTLSVATSLADVAGSAGELPPGPVLAVWGPPANGIPVATDREIEAITEALPDREVVRLQREAATEQAVRRHAGSAAILHFAAHALSNEEEPDYARLSLAPGGDDDGLLHAYEIRELRLPGSLVILSACESAGGRLLAGEGPLSLSRAFLQAGAGAVIGTLWPVGEATGKLMETFYRELARGQPLSAALRSARLALRERHPDPFFWAPFILVVREF